MTKRKFGDFLRSKVGTAMVNKALYKIFCHAALIHEMCKLGIDPVLATFKLGFTCFFIDLECGRRHLEENESQQPH